MGIVEPNGDDTSKLLKLHLLPQSTAESASAKMLGKIHKKLSNFDLYSNFAI